MKMTVKERLELPELLPDRSDLLTMMQVKDIKDKVKLSTAELKAITPKQEMGPGGPIMRWNEKKDPHKDIRLTDAEVRLLLDQVEKFNKDKKISEGMLSIVQKLKDYKPKKGK